MTKRTGMLLLLLALPVFAYLCLKFFGKNHYKLPKYFPQDVVEREINGKLVEDTVFHEVPPFVFLSSNGDSVSNKIADGKIYVADFFFTTCPGICPQMTTQLKRVQEAFIDNPAVLILSHTVDPENDSASVLKAYAEKYKAISGKWYFLTGEKNKLYDLAQKGYSISALEDSNYNNSDRFIHSDKMILVDKEKHIRGYYNGTDEKEVDRLILEINVLLKEYENNRK
jgi:protein SCO1/2